MPRLDRLPPFAAWRHVGESREGFEVVFFMASDVGLRVEGHTTGSEDGEPFEVSYAIELDARWNTRSAQVSGQSAGGKHAVRLEADGRGSWLVDGRAVPQIDGCLDVDLESSAFTNAFPMNRLGLAPGEASDAPAAYVRQLDLSVERLAQGYVRIDDGGRGQRYDYTSPASGFRCELVYDDTGLVVDYPGIAERADR